MKTTRYLTLALGLVTLSAYAEPKISDAQIAAIVVAANQVDIDAGKFAAGKTKNAEVKKFADTMVTDHTAVNKSAVDLVTKLKVSPEENDTSRALKAGGDKNITALRALKGKAFDRAYVDHEVTYHEQVLQSLDSVLIPNAQNGELKALLVKVRPAFVAHLEHAKHLQTALR
jgi:putative membrane protein